MTEQDYLIAWAVYGVAALGCLVVAIAWTGWMWRWLREVIRLLVAVVLFTPTIVDQGKDVMAPAVAITAMDLVLKVGGNVWRAALDLSTYGAVALGVYVVFALIRWPIERKLKAGRQAREEEAERLAARRKRDESDDEEAFERSPGATRKRTPRAPGPVRSEPRL